MILKALCASQLFCTLFWLLIKVGYIFFSPSSCNLLIMSLFVAAVTDVWEFDLFHLFSGSTEEVFPQPSHPCSLMFSEYSAVHCPCQFCIVAPVCLSLALFSACKYHWVPSFPSLPSPPFPSPLLFLPLPLPSPPLLPCAGLISDLSLNYVTSSLFNFEAGSD